MAIKERLLSAITSVSNSDFVRLVTSEGASRKALVSDVAKQIIENYTGSTIAGSAQSVKSAVDAMVEKNYPAKSSLTTSDYIRVVGTDNVSYKQLVSDVADVILTRFGKTATYTGDLNALAINGYWYCTSGATNLPAGFTAGHLIVTKVGTRVLQIFVQYLGVSTYIRTSADGGSTWGEWKSHPTRAEVDALSNKLQYYSIAGQASITLDYAMATRSLVTFIGGVQATRGQYIVAGYSNTLEWKAVLEATGVTLAKSGTRSLTITNTSNYSMDICIIVFAGSVTQQ